MDRFEKMLQEKESNREWSRDIALQVLAKNENAGKRNRFISLSVAASLLIIAGLGYVIQTGQASSLKTAFAYVVSDSVTTAEDNNIISEEADAKLLQYLAEEKKKNI